MVENFIHYRLFKDYMHLLWQLYLYHKGFYTFIISFFLRTEFEINGSGHSVYLHFTAFSMGNWRDRICSTENNNLNPAKSKPSAHAVDEWMWGNHAMISKLIRAVPHWPFVKPETPGWAWACLNMYGICPKRYCLEITIR